MADNIALALLTPEEEFLKQQKLQRLQKYSALSMALISFLCIIVLVRLKRSKFFDWREDHQWKLACLSLIFLGDLALFYHITFEDINAAPTLKNIFFTYFYGYETSLVMISLTILAFRFLAAGVQVYFWQSRHL